MLARIIIDNASSPLAQMNDTSDDVRGDTALMQFSLHYGKMIRFHSCDCGMLYALRMRDNSVIIIDGGEIEQSTEDACDEFMRRLENLTGKEKGEKIRVSAYICTHNHDDHMDFFIKLLKRENDVLDIERVMFNFPSKTLLEYGIPCAEKLRSRIKKYAPNAKYLSSTQVRQFVSPTQESKCFQRTRISSHVPLARERAIHTAASMKPRRFFRLYSTTAR